MASKQKPTLDHWAPPSPAVLNMLLRLIAKYGRYSLSVGMVADVRVLADLLEEEDDVRLPAVRKWLKSRSRLLYGYHLYELFNLRPCGCNPRDGTCKDCWGCLHVARVPIVSRRAYQAMAAEARRERERAREMAETARELDTLAALAEKHPGYVERLRKEQA